MYRCINEFSLLISADELVPCYVVSFNSLFAIADFTFTDNKKRNESIQYCYMSEFNSRVVYLGSNFRIENDLLSFVRENLKCRGIKFNEVEIVEGDKKFIRISSNYDFYRIVRLERKKLFDTKANSDEVDF